MIKIPAPSKELTMAKPHMPKLHKMGSKGFKPKVKMPKLGFKKFGKNA
jgi:hypothetical protein